VFLKKIAGPALYQAVQIVGVNVLKSPLLLATIWKYSTNIKLFLTCSSSYSWWHWLIRYLWCSQPCSMPHFSTSAVVMPMKVWLDIPMNHFNNSQYALTEPLQSKRCSENDGPSFTFIFANQMAAEFFNFFTWTYKYQVMLYTAKPCNVV